MNDVLLALGIGALIGAIARLVWWICRRPRGRHPRVLAAVGVGLGLVLALTACAPDHGIVHAKHYAPGYTYTSVICSSSGKSTTCIPIPEYQPPVYELDVYASSKDHGWVDVDQAQYDRVHVGDYWRK